MNKNLSTYLELLRWLAAVGVLVTHASHFLMPWIPAAISDNGRECVAVFFVLSGFVIRFVGVQKEKDWRTYASARMARLYSVVFVALGVALLADRVGMRFNPGFYAAESWHNPDTTLGNIVSYVTFTNELWFNHSIVASNEPYWSLGFEVPYYIVFGIGLYARGWSKWAMIALWAALVGPKILAYLPLWLLGVALYDVLNHPRTAFRHEQAVGALLCLVSVGLYVVDKNLLLRTVSPMYLPFSALSIVKSAAYFSIVGLAVALNILGFNLIFRDRATIWPAKVTAALRWLAGGSFTLYLTHEPLLVCLRAIYPKIVAQALPGLLATVAVVCFVYALAELGERRKKAFKRVSDLLVQKQGWEQKRLPA